MIKTVNINKYSLVRMPDVFRPSVQETNKNGTTTVDIHFGANMDIMVVVAKNKKLSEDNAKRIKILTEEK
jgi:hypothetical protein